MRHQSNKKPTGVTLVEIIIAMSIFLMMTATICIIFNTSFRFYEKGSVDIQDFQEQVIALDRMCRELQDKTTMELYFPKTEDLMVPNNSQAIIFVKEFPDEEGVEVIGYCFDEANKEIVRVIYDPGYDPGEPSTQVEKAVPGSSKIIAKNVVNLSFQGEENGLLTIELVGAGRYTDSTDKYLRTKIRNEAIVR